MLINVLARGSTSIFMVEAQAEQDDKQQANLGLLFNL
jgi:hypothetical protein